MSLLRKETIVVLYLHKIVTLMDFGKVKLRHKRPSEMCVRAELLTEYESITFL